MEYLTDLIYLIPLLFVAGVLDGIAGGGGIIALPAYMLTGMPMHSAYACNKLQSGLGTLTSAIKYMKDGFADIKIAVMATPTTIASSIIMTKLVMHLDDSKIKLIIAVCIPIAVMLMFLKRKLAAKQELKHVVTVKTVLLCLLSGALIGSYDALFGPGGGTVAMIIFSIFFNYDLRIGCGNGKIIIVASNAAAVINYILSGHMIYTVAIPCSISNMIGSYIGAATVIKKGEKTVFPAMITVLVFLVVQTLLQLLQG